MRNTYSLIFHLPASRILFIFLLSFFLPLSVHAAETRCLVCGKDAVGGAHVTYRGIDHPVCEGSCDMAWETAKQDYIEAMIETYKAGAKAKYGVIEKVIVSEKTMVREMTG